MLDLVKAHLRIDGTEQDGYLNHLIASARAECRRHTGLDTLPDDAPDLTTGLILAVQADFDGDPERRETYLAAARALWTPFCKHFGV